MKIAAWLDLAASTWPPVAADHTSWPQSDRPAMTESIELAQKSGCKRCNEGRPCGNAYISKNATCKSPPGCACEAKLAMTDFDRVMGPLREIQLRRFPDKARSELRLSFGGPDHTESIEFEMSDAAVVRLLAFLQELGPYDSQTPPSDSKSVINRRLMWFSVIDGGKK